MSYLGDENIDEVYDDAARSRKLTEKGRLYQIECNVKKRTRIILQTRRTMLLIEEMCVSPDNVENVSDEITNINELLRDIITLNRALDALLSDEARQADEQTMSNFDEEIMVFKTRIHNWITTARDSLEKRSNCSRSSRISRRSKLSEASSSGKSNRSRVIDEKARLAELKLEAEYFEKKRFSEINMEKLRIQHEMEKTKARLKVYEDHDDPELAEDKKDYAVSYTDDRFPTKPKDVGDDTAKLIKTLLKEQSAPEVNIDCFKGDPLEYNYFMATFEEAVETKIQDNRGRLTRLIKFLEGEPKDLVKHCIHEPESRGYDHAKRLLKDHYGDPYKILMTYRNELQGIENIKSGDAAAFRRLYGQLLKCRSVINSDIYMNELNSPDIIRTLQSKLPTSHQDRWNRIALDIRRRTCRPADFEDFIKFIENECTLANDPMYSRQALNDDVKSKSTRSRVEEPKGKFSRKSYTRDGILKILATNAKESCSLCSEAHSLNKCPEFLKVDLYGRKKVLFKLRLCFICFGHGHTAKKCNKKVKCELCGDKHQTMLHGLKANKDNVDDRDPSKDEPKEDESNHLSISCTKMSCLGNNLKDVINLSVVPVQLFHERNPDKRISTYALLDSCSQGSFVLESILEKLSCPSDETVVTVKTMNGEQTDKCRVVNGLIAESYFDITGLHTVKLPKTYTKSTLPVESQELPSKKQLLQWEHLDVIQEYILDDTSRRLDVGILIGSNCPKALEPKNAVPSKCNGPYAALTNLGWCVTGPIAKEENNSSKLWCNRVLVSEDDNSNCQFGVQNEVEDVMVKRLISSIYESDFNEPQLCLKTPVLSERNVVLSQEDQKFLKIMDEQVNISNGHYELPLPFRNETTNLPNNRYLAVQRATSLKRKFLKKEQFFKEYKAFMEELFSKGYATLAKDTVPDSECWYIPHHGVYHSSKPGKIRVVFDCSAQCNGVSLNKSLLSGPDLTNLLIGVFTRFRKENVAVMADIEKMFYQVKVPENQQNYLRFLWWPNGDLSKKLEDYKMCVHLFGGASSPGCSNYGLRKTADDNESDLGTDAADTLRKNFYVDDLLKSVKDENEAIDLIRRVKQMCSAGGFNLTKFVSNSRAVIESLDMIDRAKELKIDLSKHNLPSERALGIFWCVENDSLGFRIILKDNPLTRRGILSTISSIYDPLGLAAPYLLSGKRLLQQLCSEKMSWDDDLSSVQRNAWEQWRKDLPLLEQIEVPRCFKPYDFKEVVETSLHHFSDASTEGYGQASYLRLVDEEGKINVTLVMGKSRVTPLKHVTIPRLELTAAVVSAKVSCMLRRELDEPRVKEHFWTDSQVVLAYLANETKRFHTFVANRVQLIRENSSIDQWHYVTSKDNPADVASRGLSTSQIKKDEIWFNGPSFLREPLSIPDAQFEISPDDVEVRKPKIIANVAEVKVEEDLLTVLENRVSCWMKMKRIVAIMLKWRRGNNAEITVDDLQHAENTLLKLVQKRSFDNDRAILPNFNGVADVIDWKERKKIQKSSVLYKLDPFLDNDGIIRVGGRLKNVDDPFSVKHPIVLPKRCRTTNLIIMWYHQKVHHQGRGSTLNELRSNGFWIVNGNSVVRFLLSKCVKCRYLRGKLSFQKMSDLPIDRVKEAAPFTYCAVDLFGPFRIKEGRKLLKRYGVLFTCLSCRAVHLESANSLDTDSFIMALRRLISRRGNVRFMRSDNGSNFVGAERELREAFQQMDHEKVKSFLHANDADYVIEWKRNPPTASHMGGVWERQIRSIRSVLSCLMKHHGESLNDESLRTFFTEAEAIVNSRPLTVEQINDVSSPRPLTPNHILTMKSKIIMPPPGLFQREDLYCRRRWRRVQHLLNEFWSRWKKEYLSSLQVRTKWNEPKRMFQVGDIVLVKEGSERGTWPMGRVTQVYPGDDGLVRKVMVRFKNDILERPVHKLVLLVEC